MTKTQSRQSKNTAHRIAASEFRRAMLGLLMIATLLYSGLVIWRLYSLQIEQFDRWSDRATRQHFGELKIASERGPIYDRNGKYLAVSVPAGSVYLRPKQLRDRQLTVKKLAEILALPTSEINQKINKESPFVWIKRQVPIEVAERVEELKLGGVGYLVESRRYYPFGQAASRLLGAVGIDGDGLSGLERSHEKLLNTATVTTPVVRDGIGNKIFSFAPSNEEFELPKGEPLHLTIDSELQLIVDEELEQAKIDANARAAFAVMINAETGEILAMSQAPGINLNDGPKGDQSLLTNLVVESVYEPGSTFKPIIAGIAIENGAVRPTDVLDCNNGSIQVGKYRVRDVHGSGPLTVHDIVVRSSNVGMTKIGMRLGKDLLYQELREFGFGERVNLGLPGGTSGILRDVSGWALIDTATHSFGQGVAVTPLQLVRGISAIANGGILPVLYLDHSKSSAAGAKRVLSPTVAEAVREMMYGVVEDSHGTGKKAQIPGVRIGGKTGTAQKAKPDGRGYDAGKYIASFVGFADANELGVREKLTLLVAVDEPKASSIYGGTLAAPAFQKIIERSLRVLSTRAELKQSPTTREDGTLNPPGFLKVGYETEIR